MVGVMGLISAQWCNLTGVTWEWLTIGSVTAGCWGRHPQRCALYLCSDAVLSPTAQLPSAAVLGEWEAAMPQTLLMGYSLPTLSLSPGAILQQWEKEHLQIQAGSPQGGG